MAALEGHISAISHLAFNRLPGQVITLSTDDVIRIWDVQEHVSQAWYVM
jgi:WD40 repeat protein